MSGDRRDGSTELLWDDGGFRPANEPADELTGGGLLAADSWLVENGRTLGLELHRQRFRRAITDRVGTDEAAAFWRASLDTIPRESDWFPRVELRAAPVPLLALTLRPAPMRTRSAVLATAVGPDRRTQPMVKGPDLHAMGALRREVAQRGADEAVICSPDGYVVECAYSALLWWKGDTLCFPAAGLPRIPSVTAGTVLTLADALGIETAEESVRPGDLDGMEVWVLSSLHGIRIATAWIDGPACAEQPGRLATWRARLGRLSQPIDTLA